MQQPAIDCYAPNENSDSLSSESSSSEYENKRDDDARRISCNDRQTINAHYRKKRSVSSLRARKFRPLTQQHGNDNVKFTHSRDRFYSEERHPNSSRESLYVAVANEILRKNVKFLNCMNKNILRPNDGGAHNADGSLCTRS